MISKKEELFKEAEKRGFIPGTSFYGIKGMDKDRLITIGVDYSIKYMSDVVDKKPGLYCGNSWVCYPEGKDFIWGTIVTYSNYQSLINCVENLIKEFDEI